MSNKGIDLLINYKEMLEQNITSMKYKIEEQQIELSRVKEYLNENCEHDIIIDYIDTIKNGECLSNKIKYCKNCEFTF
tara:strand:+ start:4893 stop:5126 length:234 start_codon:yes stop_codon:yes gene_type:complete